MKKIMDSKTSKIGAEIRRLDESKHAGIQWKKWGPYLSERQWGTVREDYSEGGDAWNYFSHDQSRSRAYKWGEDGLAGISDDHLLLCFAIALWNGNDPILKERLFGLTNSEGNHGEDVKEYYYYLDSTPTHSYMKYLYKYPQRAYPYDDLVATNKARSRNEFEYELTDTGVFSENRYFDVQVEYAKATPENILIRIMIFNRGPETADIHVLPTLWFRNTWSWNEDVEKPKLWTDSSSVIQGEHKTLGRFSLACHGSPELLFTENETNTERIFNIREEGHFAKDAFHDYLIHGKKEVVNPRMRGTKAAANYKLTILAGESQQVELLLQLNSDSENGNVHFGKSFSDFMNLRKKEADEYYTNIIPKSLTTDQANVMRQALAGMLWSKQFYFYDVSQWLEDRGVNPLSDSSKRAPRNEQWHHMVNADIISMPDKWEYPWYAAWDLAFHVISLSLVDPDFAKEQLRLMLNGNYIHPNGQIPAYEWNFGDVNPPVLAWSTIFTYRLEKEQFGEGDIDWLKTNFQKLLLNFTWWVNRKDRSGRNAFEGGFLGLDNIGVFDRSAPLPTGGYLEQADGTAWMSIFSQNMLEIASELAMHDPTYADMAFKFTEHFLMINSGMIRIGKDVGMWDDEDGFFYDVLRLPDGTAMRLKVRSMVGLLPFCAATTFDGALLNKYPELKIPFNNFLKKRKELLGQIHDPTAEGVGGRRLASVLNEDRLRRVLRIMLDENEFLSPYGIRALSKYHEQHPYSFTIDHQTFGVNYLPGESDSGMFGGNSNWRGPIWMPVNALIIRGLLQYYSYYGDNFKVEFPTGSGQQMNLYKIAENISARLTSIFLKDRDGKRPVFGGNDRFQHDPLWKDLILFYEYFHADNGAGLGASHQTGWTGVIARLMHLFATSSESQWRKADKEGIFKNVAEEASARPLA